jgi:tight adherence protein B
MGLFRRDKTSKRLEELDTFVESEWQPAETDMDDKASAAVTAREEISRRLDNLVDRRGFAAGVRSQLRKADLKLTVSEFLLLHVAAAGLLGGAGFILRGVPGAGLGVIGGFFLPRIYVSVRKAQRLNAFNNQLGDILNLWVNSLRAGYSVPQAMQAVAEEAPDPAADEFKRVVAELQIGIPMEVALNNMLARIESEDLDLVFTAVNIQREVGGNLAEILETISHTIRERIRIKGEIRTLTASGRATGTLIGLLPFILMILLYLINAEYMQQLFLGDPIGADMPVVGIPCGWPILATIIILEAVGLAVIQRIIDIEV